MSKAKELLNLIEGKNSPETIARSLAAAGKSDEEIVKALQTEQVVAGIKASSAKDWLMFLQQLRQRGKL